MEALQSTSCLKNHVFRSMFGLYEIYEKKRWFWELFVFLGVWIAEVQNVTKENEALTMDQSCDLGSAEKPVIS